MMSASHDFKVASQQSVGPTSNTPRHKTTRDCPRVTLRLSVEDHARLQKLADGMALSTYIRAKALGDAMPRKKRRSTASVADKQALAQVLGLLGQSRIANNLNQLAYHANIGSLAMEAQTAGQITRHVAMILKGNQRANGRELALHLMNVDDNEHAVIHELRGFLAEDLIGAFAETDAISQGTKCQQYLFSLSLNPPPTAKVSVAEFETAIAAIERRMGLTGQPRALVFHEKKGRRHAHCVWSRINIDQMKAINLPHFKRRLMDISRELYLEHGWDMPAGLRDTAERDPLNYAQAEASQAKRQSRDPSKLKDLFLSCWSASDSRAAFEQALQENGYCLARGDRRGFVAVDAKGEIYSLSRWLGVKTKALSAKLGDFRTLPDVSEAIARLGRANRRTAPKDNKYLKAKLADLVARQRQERIELSNTQELRRLADIKQRQKRVPTGLKAVWVRVSGQYQQILAKLATEAADATAQDSQDYDSLIARHLTERRALYRNHAFSDVESMLAQELNDRDAKARARLYEPDPGQPLFLPKDVLPFTQAQLMAQPDLILDHLSKKQAQFSRNDVMRGLAALIQDPLDLRVASDVAMASPELVKAQVDDGAFTTADYVQAHGALTATTQEMASSGGFKVSATKIDDAIARENKTLHDQIGANLSDEQVTAIRHVLSPHQLSSVVGLAGAGKSTLLSVAGTAWESQGYAVFGATLAGKAADSLESTSGIKSRTLASLEASWKSGYEPVTAGSVVVIDEAGMVGTRQLGRVAEQLRQRGCKLVLVGDPDQLQPIQAGTPFRDIADKLGSAQLKGIRRQKISWQREASRSLATGNINAAMKAYEESGAITQSQGRDFAIAALVDDYMSNLQASGTKTSRLALAHRRIDVQAINQAIKTAKSRLPDAAPSTLFDTEHGPRAFAKGDRILFTRNDKTLGVRNGMLGTVVDVGSDQIRVEFDTDENGKQRRLTFAPQQFPAIDHGFAVSIHRSQGCTVDRSFVLSSRTLDKHLIYVAMTRHKDAARFYNAPDIEPRRQLMSQNQETYRNFTARSPSR